MPKKKRKKQSKTIDAKYVAILLIVVILLGAFCYFDPLKLFEKKDLEGGDISFHFLQLGNKYNGDCIYIKCGETDILVDAGSRTDSATTISNYLDNYVTDKKLEYVIVTHADQDHLAAFPSNKSTKGIFERYDTEIIIDFPRTGKDSSILNSYYTYRDLEVENGAKHYNALDCYNNVGDAKRIWDIGNNITLEILYNYYYENDTSDENNYSVCFMINNGSHHYLFTGDLEESGEKYLVQRNNLPKCDLFKAGHHGSKTSSNNVLLEKIQPDYVVVSCNAGYNEYRAKFENIFPTQAFINRIAEYTDNVYVTTCVKVEGSNETFQPMNGNVVISVNAGGISVSGSNNDTKLKDTEWFKENRECPAKWQDKAA